MARKIKQSAVAVYLSSDNDKFSAAEAFQRGDGGGATGVTLTGDGDSTTVHGTDSYQNPVAIGSTRTPPGSPTITLQQFQKFAENKLSHAQPYVQLRAYDCTSLDNPIGWDKLWHIDGTVTGDSTLSDPVSNVFGDEFVQQDTPFVGKFGVEWDRQSLARQTTAITEPANSVIFVNEPASLGDCGNGYPGPDKIGFIAYNGGAGVAAIEYTNDGGGTWQAVTAGGATSSTEDASYLAYSIISKTQGRLLVAQATTDAGGPDLFYGDFLLSTGDITAWTAVTAGAVATEFVTATLWSKKNTNRVYAATSGGDIFVSTDRAESFTIKHTGAGSDAINAFYEGPDGEIYAVGDGDTFLLEKDRSGVFNTFTGPTSAGTTNSHAVAVTSDGIWLGYDVAIYYNRSLEPTTAGSWTSSKSFGTNHRVETISPKGLRAWPSGGGSSQLLHVMVNDTSTPEGDVWLTADGGGNWEEITNLTNVGYNDAYFSPANDNIGWIVGEIQTTATIHKLSA